MAALVPPGALFCPSEEDLINYYLTNKNQNPGAVGANYPFTFIRVLNLYEHSPFDMPVDMCYSYGHNGSKRHWYCFTAPVLDENGTRRARGGFWRATGTLKSVMNYAGDAVVGTRRTFWFYAGNSSASAVETDWVMHEYSLIYQQTPSFVVCRLFIKPDGSSLEGSGSQVSVVYNFIRHWNQNFGNQHIGNQHIGNQHFGDIGNQHFGNQNIINRNGVQLIGNAAPDVVEASFSSENLTDEDEDGPVDSEERNNQPNNHVPTSAEAVPVPNSQQRADIPLDVPRPQPMDVDIRIQPWTAEQYSAAIDEGDFIELNDLVD